MKVEIRLVSDRVHDLALSKSLVSFENDDLAIAAFYATLRYLRAVQRHEPDCPGAPPDRHVVGDEHDAAIVVPAGEPSRSPWAGSPPDGPVSRMEPSPTRGLIEWVQEEADRQAAAGSPPGSARGEPDRPPDEPPLFEDPHRPVDDSAAP